VQSQLELATGCRNGNIVGVACVFLISLRAAHNTKWWRHWRESSNLCCLIIRCWGVKQDN